MMGGHYKPSPEHGRVYHPMGEAAAMAREPAYRPGARPCPAQRHYSVFVRILGLFLSSRFPFRVTLSKNSAEDSLKKK